MRGYELRRVKSLMLGTVFSSSLENAFLLKYEGDKVVLIEEVRSTKLKSLGLLGQSCVFSISHSRSDVLRLLKRLHRIFV